MTSDLGGRSTCRDGAEDDTLAAAEDRTGAILGVYSRPRAAADSPDVAVTLARSGAMFANDQAPLSSRTVRDNRGCAIDARGDAIFNTPVARTRVTRS